MKNSRYEFVPYKYGDKSNTWISLCERCCFYHTDHRCLPCFSTNREDKQDGYYIKAKKINH